MKLSRAAGSQEIANDLDQSDSENKFQQIKINVMSEINLSRQSPHSKSKERVYKSNKQSLRGTENVRSVHTSSIRRSQAVLSKQFKINFFESVIVSNQPKITVRSIPRLSPKLKESNSKESLFPQIPSVRGSRL